MAKVSKKRSRATCENENPNRNQKPRSRTCLMEVQEEDTNNSIAMRTRSTPSRNQKPGLKSTNREGIDSQLEQDEWKTSLVDRFVL